MDRVLNKFIKRFKYFGDNSNLHGIRYVLGTRKITHIQRSTWLVIIFLSCYGMLYILTQGSDLFQNDVISFTPETTYLRWDTDFPAVSVCEAPDSMKLQDYYDEYDVPVKLTPFHKDIIFADPKHYCRSCYECKKLNCPQDFIAFVKSYRSPCNETLSNCFWRGQAFDCCERFITINTQFGECFVFNTAHFGGKRRHLSNLLTGPGNLTFAAMESVTIDIHSPDDLIFSNFDKPIINGREGDIPFASEFILKFQVEETTNEEEVQHLPAKMRKCLFPHERLNSMTPLYPHYSYSTCILNCRALKQLKECNCTHHMLPRMNDEPFCDISGLICLTELVESVTEEEDLDADCGCLPSCVEPNYETIFIKNTPNTGDLTDELIDRGSIISIYMECLPTTRVKRKVVRSSLDYVVFVGGTAGIFFGASVLSLLEIIYLMLLRNY